MFPHRYLRSSTLCLFASAFARLTFSATDSPHADPHPPAPRPPPHAAPSPINTSLTGGSLYELLPQEELESLNQTSTRIASMMDAILPFDTVVWPHAIRDEQGRNGLFLAPRVPFATLATDPDQEALKGWLVCAILAVGKYAEAASVPLHHIGFTDASGMGRDLWYLDIDIGTIIQLHRRLVSGTLSTDDAFQELTSRWKKLTRDS